ncbi:MAG TPA: HAD-IA family hydrolase, partial [Alphaproteobacteria bacterium]|nr:HAD-IA family hydrolase [Alphaproteobacteria bacterium]
LKKRFKLAIVSNVDRESFRHSKVKLGVEFDLVVTAQDVGAYKPNPAHFHEALRRLKELDIPKECVLHVAQSLYHDHVPAKALGLSTVWVDRRHGQGGGIAARAPVEPDWTVLSLSELVDLIG